MVGGAWRASAGQLSRLFGVQHRRGGFPNRVGAGHVLARPWQWQKMLVHGASSSVTEIAEAERISKVYVSRILRLALLAPDLVEAILGGWRVAC